MFSEAVPRSSSGRLEAKSLLEIPVVDAMQQPRGIPSDAVPSDHFPLLANFSLYWDRHRNADI